LALNNHQECLFRIILLLKACITDYTLWISNFILDERIIIFILRMN